MLTLPIKFDLTNLNENRAVRRGRAYAFPEITLPWSIEGKSYVMQVKKNVTDTEPICEFYITFDNELKKIYPVMNADETIKATGINYYDLKQYDTGSENETAINILEGIIEFINVVSE